MTGTPLVSIVIPCYNHGAFLAEALTSIGTPHVTTEIIVVDDGSTDSTSDVIATFATESAFRCVRQQHSGFAAARNRGLRESRGQFVVFLDADDRLAPGAIDLGAATLDAHPECAFAFGRCRMMDREGNMLDTPVRPRIVRDHYRELLRRNYIWTAGTVIFRRDALERVGGFNPAINASGDYEVYLHIARHHPVHDHAKVVADHRKHDTKVRGNAAQMLRETLAVMSSQRPFLEGDDASLAAYHEGWHNWQEFYGAHLATEIRTAMRERRLLEAIGKTTVLGFYHPRGLWHHARRDTQLSVGARSKSRAYAKHGIPKHGIHG